MKHFNVQKDDGLPLEPTQQHPQNIQYPIPPMPGYAQPYQPTYASYVPNVDPQYINRMNNINLELYKDCKKAEIQSAKEIFVYNEKKQLRAIECQQRKAEYDEVFIHPDSGLLCIETKNTSVRSAPIQISNFAFPKIMILHRIENSNDKIYHFTCQISQEKKSFFLLEKKCHRPSYILKGLSSIGGQIMVNSESKRKDYVSQWLNMLVNIHEKNLWIPDRKGWYKDQNGKINFWEEWYTWENLLEHTI